MKYYKYLSDLPYGYNNFSILVLSLESALLLI